MAKYKITKRFSQDAEEVDADYFHDVDKTWVDFVRVPDGVNRQVVLLRLRAEDIDWIQVIA
jgi:hypothetical protein